MQHLWAGMLELRSKVSAFDAAIYYCWLNSNKPEVWINKMPEDRTNQVLILCGKNHPVHLAEATSFSLTENFNIVPLNQKGLSVEEALFFKKYLPYCFLSIKAKNLKRAVTITHFAQTLDAKIATATGDSKWIGNQENLIHAHRMRALSDGVLVGSRTVENDQPRLNVRHVKGPDPVKIILGNPNSDFQSLFTDSDQKIIVFGKPEIRYKPPISLISLRSEGGQSAIPPRQILEKLFQLGIYTVYIEGGAKTTSLFLNSKAVDILQLHIAPLIFGSGKDSIVLPHIEWVREAIGFSDYHFFPFGNSIMFVGFLN